MEDCNKNGALKSRFKTLVAVAFLAIAGLVSVSAQAEIRVLAAGGDLLGPFGTEQIFANGDLVGYVDRPSLFDYQALTTEDIVNNYDVLIIPTNTADWQYDFDWNTRVLPFLASGGGVVWEGAGSTGTAGATIFTTVDDRYLCNNSTICYIPSSPLNVLSVPGITDGISGDFTATLGYFTNWDAALSPFIQANAVDLGTISYGLYGQINAGRIVITQNSQDDVANPAGTAAEVNAYNLLINKIQWAASSTATPDPSLRFMPTLVGLSEAHAIAALSATGYVVNNTYFTTTNLEAYGNVPSQSPQPGAAGFVGDVVDLFVVKTPMTASVTVPDIKGMLTADAENTLNAVNLDRGSLVWSSHPTAPNGTIISQNRAAGQTSNEGWIVDVAQSTGLNAGRVPFVQWLTQADAEAVLAVAGYGADVTFASHSVIPAGNVSAQSPGDDSSLAVGGTVSLVVSSGIAGTTIVAVPAVEGLAQSAAVSALSAEGLSANVSSASSESVVSGDVISQSPSAGTDVSSASIVNLLVSSGSAPAAVNVPSVTGTSQSAAVSVISAAGLSVGSTTTASSSSVASGDVISQTPSAGASVAPGSSVSLVVSTGSPLVIAPSVVGSAYSNAISALQNAGLTVGNVSTTYTRRSCGRVNSQTPVGGTSVPVNTVVNLVVTRTRYCNPL